MYLRHRGALIAVLFVTFVLVAWQLVTKGWWLLILALPVLVGLPIVVALQWWASRARRRGGAGRAVEWLAAGQLCSLLAFFVTLVGFGDTDEVYLFGFRTADIDDPITGVSNVLSLISLVALLVTTVTLVVLLLRRRGSATRVT